MVEDRNDSNDRNDVSPPTQEGSVEAAALRLRSSGRNEPCPCGSGKKYKKCHLLADEQATASAPEAPSAQQSLTKAWGLFEQRRPGAAEREFRAALALDPTLTDAQVGIGMSRLSANDAEGAKTALTAVVDASEDTFTKLAEESVKDAFTRPEAQPAIRAAHALGCLAYDQERFADAAVLLEKVFRIDEGPVGTEARLIAAKALLKQDEAPRAIQVLEPALGSEMGGSRARLGLALAQFVTGALEPARANLDEALGANPHFGRALLGRIRRRVDNLAGAQPGSIEEALVYAQTYGDVWTVEAKAFLEQALDDRAAAKAPPVPAAPAGVTEAAPP
jgi:tetratricopeptide (TPR) repeat protein